MSVAEVIENCKTNAPKGFALLQEKKPGWLDRIDLDTLDMGSVVDCVLGQVYGDYFRGLKELLDLPEHDFEAEAKAGYEYGFDIHATWMNVQPVRYAALQADWIALVTAAREEAMVTA